MLTTKASALAANGHSVTILVADQRGRPNAYPLSDRFQVTDLNISQYTTDRVKGISFIINIRKLRKIYSKVLQNLNPDVVVVVERGYEDFVIPHILPSIPKVRELHSSKKAVELMFTRGWVDKILTRLYNRQLGKYGHIVYLTAEDAAYRKLGTPFSVIPNSFEKQLSADVVQKSHKIISVGRLDLFKNFADQIMMMKTIVQHYPEYTLHIYGEGRDRDHLEKLIIENNLQDHVFLEGLSSDLGPKYAESDFFIFTSLAEGFGMVLVEAMQRSLPVVAYRCPCGPGDIITHGEDGFLVEVGDRAQFTAYVLKLIEDQELRERMSAAALRKSEQYSAEVIMPRWISLFKSILHEKA